MRGREEGPTNGGPLTNEFGILDPDRPAGYYPGMRVPDAEVVKAMNTNEKEVMQNGTREEEGRQGPEGRLLMPHDFRIQIPDSVRKEWEARNKKTHAIFLRLFANRFLAAVKGAYAEVDRRNLRTRLLYAHLEPWGA